MGIRRALAAALLLAATSTMTATEAAEAAPPAVSGPTTVADAARLDEASVAYDGTNHLVVWQQYVSGNWNLYARRINGNGAAVGDRITIGGGPYDELHADVAFDGSRYLVVWQNDVPTTNGDVYGRFVGTDGGTSASFRVADGASHQGDPAVSANLGSSNPDRLFLVVWEDTGTGSADIWGRRVTAAGALLDGGGLAIQTATGSQFAADVAHSADNGGWLVVWEDRRVPTDADIRGARVRESGFVQDDPGVGLAVALLGTPEQLPSVASDGRDFLVTWVDRRSGTTFDVYANRIRASDGAQLHGTGGLPVTTAGGDQTGVAVAWNGTYLIAWTDTRAGFADVYLARVNGNGTVQDPQAFPGRATGQIERSAAVAPARGGFVVVYQVGPLASPYLERIHVAAK